jgi:hypothetical protein
MAVEALAHASQYLSSDIIAAICESSGTTTITAHAPS